MVTTRATVLVVDDDAGLRQIIQLALERQGYAVTTATNGHQALADIAAQPPALVLLDLGLPVMDGGAVLAQLRADGHTLPVVLMTSRFTIREAVAQHQPDGVLGKPFDLDGLLQVVARFLGERPA